MEDASVVAILRNKQSIAGRAATVAIAASTVVLLAAATIALALARKE